MIRLLHVADVHLGASFSAFGAMAGERGRGLLEAFRRLPERAAEEGAHAVVVAGDLFDRPQVEGAVVAQVREVFRRLEEAGVAVLAVPGNHDAITLHRSPWREDLGPVRVFRGPRFGPPEAVQTPQGRLLVYGLAFDPALEREPLRTFRRAPEEGVHVVVLHGSVPDAPHWNIGPNALRLPLEDLASLEADYVALGDYHRFRPPAEFRSGAVPACYSGSFAALDLTETGPRGFVVARVQPGGPPAVEHRDAGLPQARDLGVLDASPFQDAAEAADAVAERAGPGCVPVVRLAGTPSSPLDAAEVEERLVARFGHARVRDETAFLGAARLDEIARAGTVAGHLVRLARERAAQAGDEEERRVLQRGLLLALRELEVR